MLRFSETARSKSPLSKQYIYNISGLTGRSDLMARHASGPLLITPSSKCGTRERLPVNTISLRSFAMLLISELVRYELMAQNCSGFLLVLPRAPPRAGPGLLRALSDLALAPSSLGALA